MPQPRATQLQLLRSSQRESPARRKDGNNLVVEYMEQHAGNKEVQDIGTRDWM